ncbi:acyl-CoA dehydrogenase family protein [Nocardioides jishulii]|uniref:Acyl-CoA dehydrogenase n=1 Tax=Nocardioides jishulii TaxID=2575440 RepID=A0A4U2YT31_9ACTN|nr:acyl-CoA dehydrogenase family protein [Nocardioides jishulii]QCX26231.1 acyl-CoA dehydrogenase [Nocardioides jishulii]TKI63965.1 acyl-CoA dehydrogenase [Nocardioides jishulii]
MTAAAEGLSTAEDREALKAAAAEFTRREIAPHIQEWEDAGALPRELHKKAAAAGLMGISIPESAGGAGGGLLDTVAMQEGMFSEGATSGLMSALFTHGIALPHIIAHGSDELIDTYVRPTVAGDMIGSLGITEPGGGSDVGNIRTTAVRDGDEWVINGSKTFITSGTRADFVTTAVRTGGPGAGGISLIVVPTSTPGFAVDRKLAKMGWHSSDTAELSYVDVRVPVGNLVGDENAGFWYIAEQFVVERMALAIHGYAIAERSLALTADYCRQRDTFGKPLITRQVVRHKLVEMRRQVEAAKAYTHLVAEQYVAAGGPNEQIIASACLAKETACNAATYVCDQAVQLHGGSGYMHGTEVERHYRDARLLPIGGGATEVLTDLAAKLLGYAS